MLHDGKSKIRYGTHTNCYREKIKKGREKSVHTWLCHAIGTFINFDRLVPCIHIWHTKFLIEYYLTGHFSSLSQGLFHTDKNITRTTNTIRTKEDKKIETNLNYTIVVYFHSFFGTKNLFLNMYFRENCIFKLYMTCINSPVASTPKSRSFFSCLLLLAYSFCLLTPPL